MPDQLKQQDIAGSVFSHWDVEFPLAVTTVFPGTKIDTSQLAEWVELWIDTWSRRAQRASGYQILDVTLTVHCFVKQGTDKSRVHELADAVRTTLSQRTVTLRDFGMSGNPVVGYAKLFEPETRDLTRNNLNSLHQPLQHLVVTCAGIAQRTE